jgi:hypothetical protein
VKTPDSVVAQIFYERDGSIIQQWDAPLDTFLSESGLRVDAINLTGAGEGTLIVGLMNSQSLGWRSSTGPSGPSPGILSLSP